MEKPKTARLSSAGRLAVDSQKIQFGYFKQRFFAVRIMRGVGGLEE